MLSYIGRRVLLLVPTLFGISLVSFFLIHLAPGDPATAILGVLATPEMLATFREQHNLDQPVPVQYVQWLTALLQFDLGSSVSTPVPVVSLLSRQVVPTVLLTVSAVLIAVPTGIVTGVVAATHRGRIVDTLSRAAFLFGLSMPSFWLGLLLILALGVGLRILPVGGYVEPQVDAVATVRSLILPALTLSVPMAAVISRITRTAMLEVLGSDYVRTAQAKGLVERTVMRRHVLRNALVPTLTTVGLQIGYLLGGAIVVENVFNLPGLGRLMTTAVGSRDYGVIQGLVLLGASVVVTTQLLIDLVVVRLDPRIALR